MHGVRRGSRPSASVVQEELERSSFLADLIRRALSIRNKPLQAPLDQKFESDYAVVQRALETNPDEYTLWAFRREVLLLKCTYLETIDNEWTIELALTMRALHRHPKAYPAWQHRLWLFESADLIPKITASLRAEAIDEEEKLSGSMLSKDGRNFHGWAHRMRVRALVSKDNHNDLEEEGEGEEVELWKDLAFVEEKINTDFANYSAWHYRSALLPRIYKEESARFLSEELQFVRQAFYTEPDVQSAWFYHRWLVAGAPAKGKAAVVPDGLLEDELVACEELLALEPEARYALQAKVHILSLLGRASESGDALETLERLDPMRKGYYRYLRRKELE